VPAQGQGKIQLLDHAELLLVTALEEQKMPNGNVDVKSPYGIEDDLAAAAALAAYELSEDRLIRGSSHRNWASSNAALPVTRS
jgi:hypothetical protein